MARRLLLLSNSRNEGHGFLEHARAWVQQLMVPGARVAVVPFAAPPTSQAPRLAVDTLTELGFRPHLVGDGAGPLDGADGVFVMGGNTFRLLARLHDSGLLPKVQAAARAGLPYLGASAGSNVACPTISTTNDMPIVDIPRLAALQLIDFHLNPHYRDVEYADNYTGETRLQRLQEFVEERRIGVLGLQEGCGLRVDGDAHEVVGPAPALVVLPDAEPEWVDPGPLDASLISRLSRSH